MQTSNRRGFLKTFALGVGACALGRAAESAKQPNIIFFLADDMGWMDSTVYGSTYYETPSLERLATRSMRFTDAYSASPFCSPTRACLLTGKYPQRLHITSASCHAPPRPGPLMRDTAGPGVKVILPQSKRFLPLEEPTIAEAFQTAGYRTAHIGKWHLGHNEKFWPEHQGFDVNIGGGRWPGPPSYFSPYRISKLPDGPEGEYLADRLGEEVVQFLRASKNKPFLLNFWHYSVHAPYQGKIKYREYFEEKKDPRSAQHNAVMGAMIKSMDESLGRILDTLDQLGIADNTIFVFFSDNGGNMYDRTDREGKNLGALAPEGRTPTNNAPLRSGKGSMYEGGIRVPMLVSWPGVVKPGTISHEVVSAVDWAPTLMEMTGIARIPGQQFDGASLLPVLKGGTRPERPVFWHMPHTMRFVPCNACTAMRLGDWKLIHFYQLDERFPNEYELYNLREDIGELRNLATKMPDKVREMARAMDRHLTETGALVPKRNPDFNPKCTPRVLGWNPSRHCWLEAGDKALIVHATDRDPFIISSMLTLPVQGDMSVKIRYKSSSEGKGELFWITDKNRKYGQHQALDYAPIHDRQWHEVTIPFQAAARLRQLRVDVSAAKGEIQIESIALNDAKGTNLKLWDFRKEGMRN